MPGNNKGQMLGPVGGRIVGEVFAGLLKGDPLSFVNCDPNWTPAAEEHLPFDTPVNDDWEIADIIKAAGMPIDASDVDAVVNG